MAITSSQAAAVIEDFLNRREHDIIEPPEAAIRVIEALRAHETAHTPLSTASAIIYFTTSGLARATRLPVDIVRRTIPIMRDDGAPILATGVPAAPEPHHSGKRPEMLAWVRIGRPAKAAAKRMKRRHRSPAQATTAATALDIA